MGFLSFGVMSQKAPKHKSDIAHNKASESENSYPLKDESQRYGFIFESEDERLLKDASRSGLKKLQLFAQMIRRNRLLKSNNSYCQAT